MADKVVTAKLDIQAQISQYQSSLDNFQKELSKLHLPANLKDSFSNLMTEYKKELEKLGSSTSSGKLSVVNEKEIAKSFDKIEELYSNLIKKINSTGYKSSVLEKDYKAIQMMSKAESDYKKQVSGAQKELDKRQRTYDGIEAKIKLQRLREEEFRKAAEQAKQIETEKAKAVKDAESNLEAQKKAAEDVAKAIEKSKQQYTENGKGKGANGRDRGLRGWNSTQEARDLARQEAEIQEQIAIATAASTQAKTDYTAAQGAATAADKNAENAKKSLDAQEVTYKADIQGATDALNEQKRAVNELSEKALGDLRKSLQDSKIDWHSYGIDPEAIKSYNDLEVAIERLKNAGQQNIASEMENIAQSVRQMESAGGAAKKGFDDASNSLNKLTERSKDLDQLRNRIAYFFGLTNAVNLFKRAIRSAFNTIKDLDKVMTETAVVTQFDVSDMWDQLPEYTKRANELGVSIHSAYESATIYYQQGLKTNEVIALSNQTLKMARIAGLDAAEATDRMTNALRGFNMELNETNAERVADVYSKLAAMSASNVDEISTAMTKVASLASNANMQFETTAAFLSQIIETTRESAETAGTALKTVVARFSEVKKLFSEGDLLGTDEEGEAIDVNKVSVALRTAGIDLNEYLTGIKGLDDIFLELASKWDNLDKVQQRYIATMAAGSRQQSRFIAMMQDYGRTQELVNAANNAGGASNEQYQKTLDSLESKLAKLKNAWDEFLMGITNNVIVKGAVDALRMLLDTVNSIITVLSKATGPLQGFTKSLLSLGTVFGGLKLGRSILVNGFANLGSIMRGEGEKASSAFAGGFKSVGAKVKNVTKNVFSKQFWNGYYPPQNLKTAIQNVTVAQTQLDDAKKKSAVAHQLSNNSIIVSEKTRNAIQEKTVALDAEEAAANRQLVLSESLLNEQLVANNISRETYDTLAKMNLSTEEMEIGLALASSQAIEGKTEAEIREMIAEQQANNTIKKGILVKLASIVHTKAETIATNAETGSVLRYVAAKIAEKTAIEASTKAKLISLGVIGLIIAAVAALVFLTVKLVNAIETESETMERLRNQTQQAEETAEKAKNAYSEFTDSIDKYKDLEKEFSNLAAGTQEWKDKLVEVNQEVLDLLNNVPELGEYLSIGENGQLIISDEGINKVQAEKAQQVTNAQGMAITAQLQEKNFEYQSNQIKRDREVTNKLDELLGPGTTNRGSQFKLDLAEYLTNNPDALETQTITKEFLQGLSEEARTIQFGTSDIDWILDEYEGRQGFSEEITRTLDLGQEVLMRLKESEDLPSILAEYTQAQAKKGQEDLIINNLLKTLAYTGMGSSAQSGKYASAAAQIQGQKSGFKYNEDLNNKTKIFDKENKEQLKELYEKVGLETVGKNLTDDKELRKLYAKLVGGTADDYKDLEGKALKEAIANVQLSQEYGTEAVEIQQKLQFMTEEQIAQILAVTNPEEALNFTEKELESWDEDEIRERLKELDYEETEIEETIERYNAYKEDLITQINKNFSAVGLNVPWKENLTLATQQKTGEQLLQMQELGGNEGVRVLNGIMGRMNPAYIEDFAKAFNQLDLTDVKSIKNLSNYLEAFGVDISMLGVDIDEVESQLISAARATSDFSMENVKEQLKTTMDLAEETRGRSSYRFSDEDVQKYTAQGVDISNFEFNGQDWVYVGGTMETLATAVEANTSAVLEENKIQLQRQVESGNQLAQIASNNKNANAYAQDYFMSGGYLNDDQGIERVRGYMKSAGVETLTDSATGNTFNLDTISDTLLQRIYEQMIRDYQNLDFNQTKLDNYDSELGQDTGKEGTAIKEAEMLGLDVQSVVDFQQELIKTKELEDDVAASVAKMNAKLNTGLEEIMDSYSDWGKLIDKDSGKIKANSAADQKVYENLKKSVNKMLNTSKDLSDAFWDNAENMELLEKAAQGDTDALEGLQKAAAIDNLNQFKDGLADVGRLTDEAASAIDNFANYLANYDFPKLEAGDILDDEDFIKSFNDMAIAANMTAEEIQAACQSMGFDATVTYKTETRSIPVMSTKRQITARDPVTNEPTEWSEQTWQSGTEEVTAQFPVLAVATASGVGGGGYSSTGPVGSGSSSSGGGGGGGSSKEEKPSYWENPYDELYNLSEKINESMRTREALEREYDKLLQKRSTSSKQILQNSLDEITLLRQQLDYQQQMEAGRRRQLENVGSQIYTDDEGNRTSFADLGVTKYASYDIESGLIQIDWPALEEIAKDPNREEEGKQAEAYISKLEELVGQYEDVRDAVWEIEDKLEEIRERSIDESIEFQQRIFDAIVSQRQAIIDSFDAMSQAIEETTSKVIDNVREQIQAERQQRQNEKTEEDIADKEARLAYLNRDTSGANQLETMKLQKDIDDARQNYSDSLVDQAIDQMQKDADLAAQQRAQQLAIMQAQLDIATENGEFWSEVKTLLDDAFNPDGTLKEGSKLVQLLKDTEAFKGMSEMGQDQWIDDMVQAWLIANEGLSNWKMKKAEEAGTLTLGNKTVLKFEDGKWVDSKGNTYSNVTYDEKTGTFVGTNNKDGKKNSDGGKSGGAGSGSGSGSGGGNKNEQKTRTDNEIKDRLRTMFNLANSGQVGAQPKRHQQWLDRGYSDAEARAAQEIIEYVFGSGYSLDNAIAKVIANYGDKLKKYESGGLANYTGLAWLDGSRTKPEAILSAQDTKNFIALRDILAQFMGSGAVGGGGKSGDNYFNIDINAEIGSDYDVDRLADRIKQQIYNDSTYRNVNAISYIR